MKRILPIFIAGISFISLNAMMLEQEGENSAAATQKSNNPLLKDNAIEIISTANTQLKNITLPDSFFEEREPLAFSLFSELAQENMMLVTNT